MCSHEQLDWTDKHMQAQRGIAVLSSAWQGFCSLLILSWQQVKSRLWGSLARRQPNPIYSRDGTSGAEPTGSGAHALPEMSLSNAM